MFIFSNGPFGACFASQAGRASWAPGSSKTKVALTFGTIGWFQQWHPLLGLIMACICRPLRVLLNRSPISWLSLDSQCAETSGTWWSQLGKKRSFVIETPCMSISRGQVGQDGLSMVKPNETYMRPVNLLICFPFGGFQICVRPTASGNSQTTRPQDRAELHCPSSTETSEFPV